MPLVYDEALWNRFYRVPVPEDHSLGNLHYERGLLDAWPEFVSRRVDQFPPGLIQNSSIVVVGCGFGWLMEALIDAGVGTVVGVDMSPYIHANKATQSRNDVTIVNGIVGVDNVSSLLQSAGFPRQYRAVIDEDAASSHSDAELPAFFAGCESLLQGGQTAKIVHLVTEKRGEGIGDSAINWKYLSEWKALAPSHTWVSLSSGEVL